MVDDMMRVDLLKPFQGEGRARAMAEHALQSRPITAGNADRSVKREAAVVPAEQGAGIIGIEQAAAGEPAQHAAACPLGDAGDIPGRQRLRAEESDLAADEGLEQAVDDAAIVVDVAVERGAGTMYEADRATPRLCAGPRGWSYEDGPR